MASGKKKSASAKIGSASRPYDPVTAVFSTGVRSLINMACVLTVGAAVFVCLLVATKLS